MTARVYCAVLLCLYGCLSTTEAAPGTTAACRLPIVPGPCEAIIPRWAFDSSVGQCVSFTYGGCKGNGNNFYSQKECEESCGVMMRRAACRLPIVPGPCEAYIPRWAFDSSVGKCVFFVYGGCKGNDNQFNSRKKCEESCGVMMGREACKSKPDSGPCFGLMERFYYNSSIMTCQTFTYGGCKGNQNNFVTKKECLESCRTEAACRLPIVPGPCKASIPRWAFDSSVGKCVSFIYGGCGDNGNNFYSQKECEENCKVMMRRGDD
ncbi:hypothetical protein PO909_007471 [Leuciscus waleckii]